MGSLQAKIALTHEDILTTFWADTEDTAIALRKNLPILHRMLTEAGFVVQQLQCHLGKPPEKVKAMQQTRTLLDIHI